MKPRIETLPEKKFIGLRIRMSFSHDRTGALWGKFMPRRRQIENSIGSDLYSMKVYDPGFFDNINPLAEFDKWAVTEVENFDNISDEMECITAHGLYAVFLHIGPQSRGIDTFQYIFQTWLPDSRYLLDDRPHFEIIGEKYKHEDPESEEEFWIPIIFK